MGPLCAFVLKIYGLSPYQIVRLVCFSSSSLCVGYLTKFPLDMCITLNCHTNIILTRFNHLSAPLALVALSVCGWCSLLHRMQRIQFHMHIYQYRRFRSLNDGVHMTIHTIFEHETTREKSQSLTWSPQTINAKYHNHFVAFENSINRIWFYSMPASTSILQAILKRGYSKSWREFNSHNQPAI